MAAGHELALVGGPVRDALLGRPLNDLDFTTSARPDETEQLARAWSDAVWDMGRDFGTIGCRKGVTGRDHDVPLRRPTTPTSRKPEVAFGDTLDGDLGRRDFTVNAMAVRLPGPRSSTRSAGMRRPCRAGAAHAGHGRRTPSPTTRCA